MLAQNNSGSGCRTLPGASGLVQVLARISSEMSDLGERMVSLEKNVDKMQASVGAISELSSAHNNHNHPHQLPPVPLAPTPPPLSVAVADPGFETLWYAERVFPEFVVSVLGADGRVVASADGWTVTVSVLDGYGQAMPPHLFTCPPNATRNGVARISSLKFHAVSSKNGGHFRLSVRVSLPQDHDHDHDHDHQPQPQQPSLPTLLSPEIVVLSSRLFHNPKALPHQLSPSHPLSALPGVGKCYATRFAALGVTTIGGLAALDVDEMDDGQLDALMSRMRKGKGTMTAARLVQYARQAKAVVVAFDSVQPGQLQQHQQQSQGQEQEQGLQQQQQQQQQQQAHGLVFVAQPSGDVPQLFRPVESSGGAAQPWDHNNENSHGNASDGSDGGGSSGEGGGAEADKSTPPPQQQGAKRKHLPFAVPAPKRAKPTPPAAERELANTDIRTRGSRARATTL